MEVDTKYVIHNFVNFRHTKKFFSNLEMADRFKIIDIKRFDEIWCLAFFNFVRFKQIDQHYFCRIYLPFYKPDSKMDTSLDFSASSSCFFFQWYFVWTFTNFTGNIPKIGITHFYTFWLLSFTSHFESFNSKKNFVKTLQTKICIFQRFL